MLTQSVYNEVAEFMTIVNPAKVIAFKPSATNQTRFDFLLENKRKANYLAMKKASYNTTSS